MHRHVNPLFYFRKLYRMYYLRFAYDRSAIDAEEDGKLLEFGDIAAATGRLDGILASRGRSAYDPDKDSVHMLLWSMLSLRVPAKRILEIGTFEGEGTQLLARLFPDAEVTTVELPDDDPLFRTFYRRTTEAERQAFRLKQEKNIDLPNIKLVKANSFFLPGRLVAGTFDLIWVDGGHLYPEVAWDICNAWHLAAPGGIILFDDVLPERGKKTPLISSESFEALDYLRARVPAMDLKLFLKRRFPFRAMDVLKRTYVGAIVKPTKA